MNITSESAMLDFGRRFAGKITPPAVFELIGDVGAGKTTFTRGLASGLGIVEPVTSPSFTLSKRYAFEYNHQPCELVHYDFYRLDDPGLMREELEETLSNPNAIVVIEWGGDAAELLPETKYSLQLQLQDDGSRKIVMNDSARHAWETTK